MCMITYQLHDGNPNKVMEFRYTDDDTVTLRTSTMGSYNNINGTVAIEIRVYP